MFKVGSILVFLMLAFTGCSDGADITPQTQASEGVVLYGCSNGWSNTKNAFLENTNSYPVRVRSVRQGPGEITLSIDRLEPGVQFILMKGITEYNGFYIYTMDGALVGWISARCP